jgi:hypothetical protein
LLSTGRLVLKTAGNLLSLDESYDAVIAGIPAHDTISP